MDRIRERFQRNMSKVPTNTANPDCGCTAPAMESDCCGDEGKRVGYPPIEDSQGTLRSTQVPWLAIR